MVMAQPSWHRSIALGACLLLQAPAALWANDITPNGAQGFGTAVSNNGSGDYIITGGTVSGQKLLHGFDTFNIPAGGSATFDGVARTELIQSIFAVVSTGSSTLDGALNVINFNLASTSATPELFLMNANGFILGTGFSTNVQQLNLFAADGILLGCSVGSSGCGGPNQYQLLSVQTTGADLQANTSWSSSNQFKGLVSDASLDKTIVVLSDSLTVSELSLAGSWIHFDSDSDLSVKQLKIVSQWFPGAWTGDLGDLVVGSFTPSNSVGSFGQFTPDPTVVEVDPLDTDADMLPDPLSIYAVNGLGWTEPGDVVFAGAIRAAGYAYQSPAAGSPLLNEQQAVVKVFARQAYISPVEFPGGTTSPFGPNAGVSSSEAISYNGLYFGFAATIDIDPALHDDYYIVDPYAYWYDDYSEELDMWTAQDSDEGLDYNDYEAAYDDEDMALAEGDDGFDFGDGTDEAASDGSSDITTDDSADVTAAASLPSVDVPANEASANFSSGEQAAASQAATALGLSAVEALSPQQAQQILQQAIIAVQAQGAGGQNRSSVWREPATLLAATSPGSGTKGLLPQQFNRALYNPAILQLRFTEARGRTTNVDTDAFLDLTLIPASGAIVGRRVEVAIGSFSSQLKQLYSQLSRQEDLGVSRASAPARRLYEVLIGPLRDELERQKVTTLLIGADRGLQGVPYAALHSGRDFVGERFAFALTPSLSLTNLTPSVVGEKRLLAAGASQFDGLAPLPLVPQELKAIAASERSDAVLNASFTPATIERTAADPRYHRIHLATHAEFLPGGPSKSVLYSGTGPMSLATLANLRKQRQGAPLDLIVLSACRTALGDSESELGFAGLALQAGARSAIGTLWYVDDVATSAYFIQVYRYLEQGLPKAEALQFTRRDFVSGRVQLSDDQIMAADGQVLLSGLTKVQQRRVNQGLVNPFYWAGIELLGAPW